MTDIRQIEGVRLVVEAARGPSFAEIARRTGRVGDLPVAPTDTDQSVLDKQTASASAQADRASLAATSAAGFVGGILYPTDEAGLAAVPADAYFTVVGDDASTYAILYRKVAGAAVEQARYVSKAAYEGAAGASFIGFKRPENFSIVRSLYGRNLDKTHIRDWADPANSASANTLAMQHAFDAVLSSPRQTLDMGEKGDFVTTGLTLPTGSDGLALVGRGARLVSITDAPVLTIGNATNATIDGLRLRGNGGTSATNQTGILLDGAGYCRIIDVEASLLSTGIDARNAKAGLSTGAIPQPTEVSGFTIRSCYNGIYTEDDGAGNYGEYLRIQNGSVTDCRNAGVLSKAGNTSIAGVTANGNGIGFFILSTGTANGDHGSVVGCTANHNKRGNFYAKDLIRSLIVTGNNFWAAIGDGSAASFLEGTGDFAETFGAVLNNVRGVVFTNNVLGRNRINLGLKMVIETIIAHNYLTTDPGQTLDQIRDFSDFALTSSNRWGPNSLSGTWSSGGILQAADRRRAPAFLNGWSAFGGTYSAPAFWKDEAGVVHLEGLIKGGTLANSAFTLPLGFRPIAGDLSLGTVSDNAPGFVQVTTAGSVIPAVGSSTWVSLDGLSFRAAP